MNNKIDLYKESKSSLLNALFEIRRIDDSGFDGDPVLLTAISNFRKNLEKKCDNILDHEAQEMGYTSSNDPEYNDMLENNDRYNGYY